MKIQEFKNLSEEDFGLIKPFFKGTRFRDINKINTVVLHWTGGSNIQSDINVLNKNNFGYHFLIDQDGLVYQGSPVNKVVSHAGNSYGPNGDFLNGNSIGISFSMLGDETPFNDRMFNSCKNLILDLSLSLPNLKFITGHHWVSPRRKIDPYTFDFNRLINELGSKYELWKTGYAPFPKGLTDCSCIKRDNKGNCIKSVGSCKGPGNYGYSERNLTEKVFKESFQSDLKSE